MNQRYKKQIAYLWPKNPLVKGAANSYDDNDTHEQQGIPFYCEKFEMTRRVAVPMSNSYRPVTETVFKTDADLTFAEDDRISFVARPNNDVNSQDFSFIVSAINKPRKDLDIDMKYRTKEYLTWEIRIS